MKNPVFHKIALEVGGAHYPTVGGELLERYSYALLNEYRTDYKDMVIDLHNIARLVEMQLGQGQLSADIRSCADRLHELTKVQQ